MNLSRRVVYPFVALVVIAVVVVAVASAGGNKSGSSAAGSSGASRAQFIAKADAVCKKWGQAELALSKQLGAPAATAYYSNLRVLIGQAEARGQGQLYQLRALPVPAGESVRVTKVWGAAQHVLADTHNLGAAVASRQVPQIEVAEGVLKVAVQEYHDVAQAYGFTVCGQ